MLLRPLPGRFGTYSAAEVVDHRVEQPDGVGVWTGGLEGAVDVHRGCPVRIAGSNHLQAGGQLVGGNRCPGLPSLDDGRGEVEVPREVEVDDLRRGFGAEGERRDHAEVA